jgi:hypothetical protein
MMKPFALAVGENSCLHADSIRDRLIKVDDFIESLWSIHLKVKEEGYVQVRV